MKVSWKRLIRFESTDGKIYRGEPVLPSEDFDLGFADEMSGLKAKVIQGDDMYDTTGKTKVTDTVVEVKKLLGPLAQDDVPILRCVGLNYAKHSQSRLFMNIETGRLNRVVQQLKKQGESRPHFRSFSSSRIRPCMIIR